MIKHFRRAYLASGKTIWVVPGGLKSRWVILLDRGHIWPLCSNMGGSRGSEGERGFLVIMPDRRASLASVSAI